MYKLIIVTLLAVFIAPEAILANCVKGNCNNGYGTFVYPNKDKYIGNFFNGKPHGKGILYFANGNKYIGHWIAEFREGEGRFIFVEGHEYFGQFKKNQFSGEGIMTYSNGDRYEGLWSNSKPQGEGIYFFANGKRYEGYFENGRFDGKGTMYYADGTIESGSWRNGSKVQNPASAVKEESLEEMFVESPSEHSANNAGNNFDRNCNTQYCDRITGNYTYTDGSKYYGEFLKGLPEGQGKVFYSNGDVYQGGWKNHAPHGKGVMNYTNGQMIGAIWEFGRPTQRFSAEEEKVNFEVPVEHSNEVRIWAVVVGVSRYEFMPVLSYTDDDAYQFYAFLKSPEGGALPDHQVKVLIDEDATRSNVLRTMRETILKADENDVVLFYFSGHGLEGAFLPSDYDGFNRRIAHQEVSDIMQESKARHKLVIADACHSGSLLAAKVPVQDALAKYYKAFEQSKGGIALMMSSKREEYSLEDAGLRSGVFSHFLIEGLKGKADYDGNKILTIEELFDYVYNRVRGYTANVQTPTLSGNFDRTMPVGVIR